VVVIAVGSAPDGAARRHGFVLCDVPGQIEKHIVERRLPQGDVVRLDAHPVEHSNRFHEVGCPVGSGNAHMAGALVDVRLFGAEG